MNIPLKSSEVKDLKHRFNPSLFPNRKSRRRHLQKNPHNNAKGLKRVLVTKAMYGTHIKSVRIAQYVDNKLIVHYQTN